jgi:hypothetical protein
MFVEILIGTLFLLTSFAVSIGVIQCWKSVNRREVVNRRFRAFCRPSLSTTLTSARFSGSRSGLGISSLR